jgi:hypothetical protein
MSKFEESYRMEIDFRTSPSSGFSIQIKTIYQVFPQKNAIW